MAKIRPFFSVQHIGILISGFLLFLSGCSLSSSPAPTGGELLASTPTIKLPTGESLLSFTRRILVPHFEPVMNEEIIVPSEISTSLLDVLAPLYRLQRETWLGLNPEQYRGSVGVDPFSEIRGESIDLSRSAVAIKGERLGLRDSNQSRALATLVQYPLFQLGKALRIRSSWSSEEFLMIPINRNNLRVFIGENGQNFSDPSYINYCAKLERMRRPEFFAAWVSTLLKGFDAAILENLTAVERSVLYETAGIYLAESFKRIRLVGDSNAATYLSGENISSMALLSSIAGQPGSELSKYTCSFFQKGYRTKIKLREKLEIRIAEYLRKHHFSIFRYQKGVSTKGEEGVFRPLYSALEGSQSERDELVLYYDKIIEILIRERAKIGSFVGQKVSKISSIK